MDFPSLERLGKVAVRTLRRFPVVLALAVVAAVAGIGLVERSGQSPWLRLLATASLGIPLVFATSLLAERRDWSLPGRLAVQAAALAGLAAFFLAWPGWSEEVAARRWGQLAAGFHLLAAFLPWVGRDEPRGFWQYNRALFERFLVAGVHAAVLFVGLALALAALDQLFGLPVGDEAYGQLWFVLALAVHPWLFLAGVPDDLDVLDAVTDYPRGLEIFTRYVLVPLVTVYLAILTAYAGKVLLTWDWPSGWIGWLVSGVAVAGILAALLVYPARDDPDRTWIRTYDRWFWPAVIPSVALLMLAVGQRIGQYGVTENRYFLAVLAAWLGTVAVYYTVRRNGRLEAIPRSLCVLALVTFVGPWSAYAVSERSQRGRLEELLQTHGLVESDTVRTAAGPVSLEARREISATVRYLVRVHGPEAVRPVAGGGLLAGAVRGSAEGSEAGPSPRDVVSSLGLEYVEPGRFRAARTPAPLRRAAPERPVSVEEFRVVLPRLASEPDTTRAIPGADFEVRVDSAGVALVRAGKVIAELSVAAVVPALEEQAPGGEPAPSDERWIRAESGGIAAALWVAEVAVRRASVDSAAAVIERWEGDLYLAW